MAGAGAEIMNEGGAKKEPEPKIKKFGSATLLFAAFCEPFDICVHFDLS